jgi:hypothetical protein
MPLKTKKLRAKWKREYREKRYARGICQNCNELVWKDKTRCRIHLIAQAKSQKDYRIRHETKNNRESSIK